MFSLGQKNSIQLLSLSEDLRFQSARIIRRIHTISPPLRITQLNPSVTLGRLPCYEIRRRIKPLTMYCTFFFSEIFCVQFLLEFHSVALNLPFSKYKLRDAQFSFYLFRFRYWQKIKYGLENFLILLLPIFMVQLLAAFWLFDCLHY